MSRKRRRSHKFTPQPSTPPSEGQTEQSPKMPLKRIVGMISVKTIRSPDGNIIIKQGEKIREEVFQQHEDEIILEIIANAMPSGSTRSISS